MQRVREMGVGVVSSVWGPHSSQGASAEIAIHGIISWFGDLGGLGGLGYRGELLVAVVFGRQVARLALSCGLPCPLINSMAYWLWRVVAVTQRIDS